MPPWLEKKLLAPNELEKSIGQIRQSGCTIATLNGSFDLLHAGHLYIIHQASLQADHLIVALNSDRSIQLYKSPKRPIITLQHRLEMMAALEFVHYVTWFEETDPRAILSRIKPDVHVDGAEYGVNCIEADTVRQFGRLHLVDRIPALSTSAVIEKICSAQSDLTCFDQAKHSKIDLNEERHSQIGKGDEEDRFGQAAAGQNGSNLTVRSIQCD